MTKENKIRLVKNGIFPIIKNQNGEVLENLPETGQDFPGTFQGEGKLLGVPVLFIRTAGCNLRCIWNIEGNVSPCDTPYASFDLRESEYWQVADVVKVIKQNRGSINHVVISGGEPMLQKTALIELCYLLKKTLNVHITIETNATVFIKELSPIVDFFSLSPKLKSSIPDKMKLEKINLSGFDNYTILHEKRRLNIQAIQQFINLRKDQKQCIDFQLKFVIAVQEEENEIQMILSNLSGWKNEDIILMPVGLDQSELARSTHLCWTMAVRKGWRFTPRLHIDVFGNKAGV